MGAPKEHTALQGRVQRPGESRRAASVLTDHLIGKDEQARGNREAEGLGRLEIDAEMETRRLLEWQVRRLVSPQNTLKKSGRAIVNFIKVWAVGRQTAIAYIVRPLVGGRQPMFGSKFVDPSAIEEGEYIRDHENCVRWVAHHTCKGFIKIFRLTHAEWLHPNPHCPCGVCGPLVSQRHTQITLVKEHRDGAQRWHHLFEQFETLGSELDSHIRDASNVTAWARETFNQTQQNWIAACFGRHDWNGCRGILGGRGCRKAKGHDQVHLARDNILGKLWQLFSVDPASADFERNIAIGYVAVTR